MHPKWQEKILDFYRGLFTINGKQTTQMIFATHSEYVIRSALKNPDNVLVIVLRDNNGVSESKNIIAPSVLPKITAAETNYLAFDIASVDYHIELYSCLQVKAVPGDNTIIGCDNYIANTPQYTSNKAKYQKISTYRSTTYQTLPTYIRNAIDHPSSGLSYTEEELRVSIEFMIELLNKIQRSQKTNSVNV